MNPSTRGAIALPVFVFPFGTALLVLFHFTCARLTAQSPPSAFKFEVASIKQNKSGEERVSGGFLPGGLYRVANYPLRSLIAAAFMRPQVNPDFLIAGGPEWMDSDRFDIEARAAGEFPSGPDGPTAPRRLMLQALLADRFGLRVHYEPRDRDFYALTPIRSDQKWGPQLRLSTADCTAQGACAVKLGPGNIASAGMTISQLMNLLPRFVDRVVVDNTGLADRFELRLTWTPAPGEWIAPVAGGNATAAPDGPSLFTAVQEQLGLKLQPRKGPVDTLIVDHAEKPTQN
jgi:uncharacterized protein (TIGR03435 family)